MCTSSWTTTPRQHPRVTLSRSTATILRALHSDLASWLNQVEIWSTDHAAGHRRGTFAAQELVEKTIKRSNSNNHAQPSSGPPPRIDLRKNHCSATFQVPRRRTLGQIERTARPFMSDEHFTVDGTLIEAWASQKSFRPKDGTGKPAGTGGEVDFKGEKRKNQTHASTTDPDARLYRKSRGSEAKLSYMGHVLMENRNGFCCRRF